MAKCVYFKYMDCGTIIDLQESVSVDKSYELLPNYCAHCDKRKNKARASGYRP